MPLRAHSGKSMAMAHESGSSQVVDSKHTQSAHVGIASQHKWNLRALIKALHTYFRHSGLFINAHSSRDSSGLCQPACANMLVPTWKSSGADSWIFTASVPQDQGGNGVRTLGNGMSLLFAE